MTEVCFEKTSKPKFWSGANTTWEILKEGVWRLGSAKVWELPPWTTQNQTSISFKSSPPFSTFNKKMPCLEIRWPAYRISHHLLPQYFLLLQWSPQSPRSVCQKSLMENASNFEALLASDKARTSANKLRRLQQGTRSAIVYASEFRQFACDVN
jgi:hypothetical protein